MSRLEALAKQINNESTPPVHLWRPASEGDIDIEIDHLGRWFHEGGQIKRAELVCLFASILWFEHGEYYLVTPVEKLKIRVADCPFLIQAAELVEHTWVVTTNTSQQVIVGEQHPVELRMFKGQKIPYVKIRYDLWGRVSRGVYYQWVESAMEGGDEGEVVLWSGEYRIELA